MALDYEVHAQYRTLPLSKLLEAPITCFQGVGESQSQIMEKFFRITTVHQLANLPFFLWALGVQELAVQMGSNTTTSVEEIAQRRKLKFTLREEAMVLSPRQLLDAPVGVLKGITPDQTLALYDAFRVTTILQLAHNRIMLEARIIAYLNGPGKNDNLNRTDEEIASILLAGAVIPDLKMTLSLFTQRDEKLRQMTTDLTEHLRDRLETLKDRADHTSGGRESRGSESAEDRMALIMSRRTAMTGGLTRSAGLRPSSKSGKSASKQAAAQAAEAAKAAQPETVSEEPSAKAPSGETSQKVWIATAAGIALALVIGIWALSGQDSDKGTSEGDTTAQTDGTGQNTSPGAGNAQGKGTGPRQGGQTGGIRPKESPASARGQKKAAGSLGEETTHKVKRGDTLWDISRRYYKDPVNWPAIWNNNKKNIQDPDLIYPDQEFKVPPNK
ncbi:MAG: LysM peptidoglycan-binding domain-containing protein [Deltaproteobacteria bacterium]|nr:LysM peptidoglycan-binding domain-containing protein [Deltaproteobacteria bacterium]